MRTSRHDWYAVAWAVAWPAIRTVLLLGVGFAAGLIATHAECAEPPTIVVLVADDLRREDLAYMPSLQGIAARGVLFDGAVTPYPLCTPSRVSLLTGQAPSRHGVYVNRIALADLSDTIATRLKAVGYRTAIIGKLGNKTRQLTEEPPGWDVYDVFDKHSDYGRDQAHVLANRGTDFLRECAHDGVPCLLYLATTSPHGPLPGPEECAKRGWSDPPAGTVAPRAVWQRRRSAICGLDMVVDKINRHLPPGSTFIFLSDHGFELDEFKAGKNDLLLDAVRLPLVIDAPDVMPSTRGELVTLMDVTVTVLEIAGARGDGLDGRPLSPLLHGSTERWLGSVTIEAR